MKIRDRGIAILLCVAAVACSRTTTTTEFVCYNDGELTERHVGVADATAKDDVWLIRYVEETIATYTPHRGEACGLERVR